MSSYIKIEKSVSKVLVMGRTVSTTIEMQPDGSHCVKKVRDQIWAFGILDVSKPTEEFVVEYVGDRRIATISALIRPHVQANSILHTDGAKVYQGLFNQRRTTHSLRDLHMTHVVHCHNIQGQERFKDTSKIEGLWGILKRQIKRQYVTISSADNYRFFLHEAAWRVRSRAIVNKQHSFPNKVQTYTELTVKALKVGTQQVLS